MGKNVLNALRRRDPAHAAVLFPRSTAPLHAMLTGGGRERRRSDGYDWHGLKRTNAEFALFQHTFAGRGRLIYEGREFTLEPGRTMMLFFPHENRYRLVDDDPWDFFWVCVNGTEVMRLWREAVYRLGPVAALSGATLDAAADACTAALDRTFRGPGDASAHAYRLAAALLDEAYPPHDAAEHPRRPADIQRAVDRLRHHLGEPITVYDLADAAGCSRWHFTRRFTASEGVSPGEFITRQKMKHAAAMLQSTADPVKTVAFRCGYHDPNYFAKAFRRCLGVSPTEFRRHRMFGGSRA